MTFDLLIHNGTILTMNADFDVIDNGWVGIKKTTISHVGPRRDGSRLPAAGERIDAKGGLIMPGLVNAHTHLPMTLFRGLADDLPLHQWLNDYMFPAESRYIDPDTTRVGSLLACAELLLSGTTTCCDGYFHENEVANAVEESGMRAVLGQGVVDFPVPGVPDPQQNVAVAEQFVGQWRGVSPRIDASIFCHSPYTCSADTLKRAKRIAIDADVLFQIHVAETRDEVLNCKAEHGMTPVAYLDRLNILDRRTLLAHAVWVTPGDMDIISRSGARVSHNPESNMKLASGIAPIPEMLEAGITLALGTDGSASNNDLDLFGAMGMAARLHKVSTLDPTAVDAARVLKMATIKGAEAIGLSHCIGSVETGKEADIIVVDTAKPHLTPMYHPVSHLVYAAKGSDVADVVVAGKTVVRDGILQSLDLSEIIRQTKKISLKIKSQSKPAEQEAREATP